MAVGFEQVGPAGQRVPLPVGVTDPCLFRVAGSWHGARPARPALWPSEGAQQRPWGGREQLGGHRWPRGRSEGRHGRAAGPRRHRAGAAPAAHRGADRGTDRR
ncbi:hypothetical protein GXW82_27795 [Streptacidiphilus sp. 4-A2]|nr:hypothetical protein [Streptacidiphilus sp. 4-A2]